MQFVVPQFIEVESKVIGPISVRQFIILMATAGIMFIWYSIFSTVPFLIISVFTFAIGGTFAFAKVNSQPFHEFALSLTQTIRRPKLSLWHRVIKQQVVIKSTRKDKKEDRLKSKDKLYKPDVSREHIAELSMIVDTKGQYSPEDLQRLREEQATQKVTPNKPNQPQ